MAYTPPFIPRADGVFRTFAQMFCENLDADPARYGLAPAETGALLRRFREFQTALGRATNENTRGRPTIVAKDDSRSILQSLIQQYAANIRANDGIDDGDKIRIGVRPRNIAHNDRTAPSTAPLLKFIGSIPGVDQLTYNDSNTPDSKAKPRGAERLELWRIYCRPADAPAKVSNARLVGSFKKNKMLVDQDLQRDSRLEGDGKPTYWARWAGYDGTVGPWSLALTLSAMRKEDKAKDAEAKAKQADANAADDQSLKMAA